MTKTLLIAGAAILVVYILVSRSGGKLFQLAPPTRLAPTRTPPPTSGPGTRYRDANVWTAVTAAAPSIGGALGKWLSSGTSSSSSSAGGGGSWDSSSDNSLPLDAGTTAYADDTTHDDLLS